MDYRSNVEILLNEQGNDIFILFLYLLLELIYYLKHTRDSYSA